MVRIRHRGLGSRVDFEGIVEPVKRLGAGKTLTGRRAARAVGRVGQNLCLLTQAALQHLVDDPALLAVQVSRRLPFRSRLVLGHAIERLAPFLPGLGALGSVMAGRHGAAVEVLARQLRAERPRDSRVAGEVAILVDRYDLLPENASPASKARASWSCGDMSGAVATLEAAGQGRSRYARRLRSELDLLQPADNPSGRTRPSRTIPPPARRRPACTASAHELAPTYAIRILPAKSSNPHCSERARHRVHGVDADRLPRHGRHSPGS